MFNFKVWVENKDSQHHKVRNLLDGQSLILYFTKDDGIYGAPEESRVVFARMKNPDDKETPEGWLDDANFMAIDLMKALSGEDCQSIFSDKDLPKIHIIDRDKAEKLILKKPAKSKNLGTIMFQQEPEGAGFIQLKDKK